MNKLIVLDPALMSMSGHHAGFALMAAESKASRADSVCVSEVEFVCSHYICDELSLKLKSNGCLVSPSFYFNFYENFSSSDFSADIDSYILSAAMEYAEVIQNIEKNKNGSKVVYFHPCLSWDHANALYLALRLVGGGCDSQHLVCAMFNPGVSVDSGFQNSRLKQRFEFSFGALDTLSCVEILASDYELSLKYSHLLGRASPLKIHPCYVFNWEKYRPVKTPGSAPSNRIVLYMGDAKKNKGFLELPKTTKILLEELVAPYELYIQFSISWPDFELEEVAAQLSDLERAHECLTVEQQFISDKEMHEVLTASSFFLFNYDLVEYKEKSSGFLWILAHYNIPIFCCEDSWVAREARRLGVGVVTKKWSLFSPKYIKDYLDSDSKVDGNLFDKEYSKTLYGEFWSWLAGYYK